MQLPTTYGIYTFKIIHSTLIRLLLNGENKDLYRSVFEKLCNHFLEAQKGIIFDRINRT